ncbi:hypothetical protein [Sorangium sp. So ce1335]|uniref:hypothetical protein n=1 Tax=Sorangium sp. So ce1335 TaxID=3133335 RepID=UPI003F5FBCDD
MHRPIASNPSSIAPCLTAGALLLCTSRAARADIVQPNGMVIPAYADPLSSYLNGSESNDNIDEGIAPVADAAVNPELFSPLCVLRGKYIAKGGIASFAVGWYNADDRRASDDPPRYVPLDLGANLDTPSPASDIQLLFPFSTSLPPPGQRELTGLSIRDSPAYLGGLIGFVLVPNPNGTGVVTATQYHYTEHRFNVQCTRCASPGPWFSTLVYRSNALPDTFYLGFEDLDFSDAPGAAGVNGNDLDYEDFLFRLSGILCRDAGQPCEVPDGAGACRAGLSDCDDQGQPICKPFVEPGAQAERCDGVDNDCNGAVDEGAPCPESQVCSRGRCVDRCGRGEFPCQAGLVCEEGACVEPACAGVTCAAGEVCDAGACRAPCDGVVCPVGQRCRGGRCLDPCAGIPCDDGDVCVDGACVIHCGCRGCSPDERCAAATGQCVEAACDGVVCGPGTACRGGICVDRCDGVVCPAGERCKAGACTPAPAPAGDTHLVPSLDAVASSGALGGPAGEGGGAPTGPTTGIFRPSSDCVCGFGADVPSSGRFIAFLLAPFALGACRRRAPSRRTRRGARRARPSAPLRAPLD